MSKTNPLARFLQLLAELVGQTRFRVAVLLGTMGIGALLVSYYFETDVGRLRISSFVISSLGAALLVTAVAEFILLEHTSRAMREQTEKTLNQLRDDFSIVTHSIENGLEDILPPRRSGNPSRFMEAVSTALTSPSGEVRIIGFSLREFLDGGQALYMKINDLLNNDHKVNVRMLLLDPTSEAAHLRTVVEQGPVFQLFRSAVYRDTSASIYALEDLIHRSQDNTRFKISARFSNFHPTFYMVATSESLFLEPYHLGRLATDPPCIGGFVPILRFNSSSNIFERACAHFDYIWNSIEESANRSIQNAQDAWVDGRYLRTRTLEEIARAMEEYESKASRSSNNTLEGDARTSRPSA